MGIREKIQRNAKTALLSARAFLGGVPFMFFETFAAVLIAAFRLEVLGAVLFVALISLKLLVCEDTLSTTLPFLLLSAFLTSCYDSYDTFIVYLPVAPVVVFCVVFHFVVYARPIRGGESGEGIALVALAVTLGGVGGFSVLEYAKGAYYILGLGAGMLVAYFLMKSRFSMRYGYDIRKRFALTMTLLGTLCACMVLFGYARNWLALPNGAYPNGFSPNNIATLLMFAMPFPTYLGRKYRIASALVPVFFGAICATQSRGGLLMGGVEFIVCCVLWILDGKYRKERIVACALSVALIALLVGGVIRDVLVNRLFGQDLTSEARYIMIGEAFANFKSRPLFGTGILDDSIAYGSTNKKGTLTWYHMMIPQVIGSMGIVGVFAYGMQILGRVEQIFKNRTAWSLCLGVSYLGVLLMTQVNPGEFCPLPFELLTVLLFVLQERRLEENSLPIAACCWGNK